MNQHEGNYEMKLLPQLGAMIFFCFIFSTGASAFDDACNVLETEKGYCPNGIISIETDHEGCFTNVTCDADESIICPIFIPPAPGFCEDGKIVVDKDENGCLRPPRCVRPIAPFCPILIPPGPNACPDGKIEVVKDPFGCISYKCVKD